MAMDVSFRVMMPPCGKMATQDQFEQWVECCLGVKRGVAADNPLDIFLNVHDMDIQSLEMVKVD